MFWLRNKKISFCYTLLTKVLRLLFFQVKGVFIDKRAASAPANILPKSKPILHQLRGKDPVELENCGYVSISRLFPANLGKGPWPKLGKNDQLNIKI